MEKTPDINQELNIALDRLCASIPDTVDAAKLSYISKLPFTLSVWEASLRARALELGESGRELFNSGRLLPAAVIARSLMETTAIHFWMTDRVSKVDSVEKVVEIQEFIFRGALGSRNWSEDQSENPESLNALSAIDKAAKRNPKFRELYDQLCEHAHPNLEGTLLSFSLKNEETHISQIGKYLLEADWVFVQIAILVSLLLLFESMEAWAASIEEFSYWSEEGSKSGDLT